MPWLSPLDFGRVNYGGQRCGLILNLLYYLSHEAQGYGLKIRRPSFLVDAVKLRSSKEMSIRGGG